MSEFDLDPKKVYKILEAKGVTNLYHANTISTSITFLESNNLLSRKYIESNDLFQTPQYTDTKDKKYGIWDDIFVDAVDIHDYLGRYNYYGPFIFSFNLNLLNDEIISSVRITKKNPSNWNDSESEDDWYFSDLNDFENSYMKGNKISDVGKMFLLKGLNGKMPLRPHLHSFIFDNPDLSVNYENKLTYLFDIITPKINEIIGQTGYDDIIKQLRHKNASFKCSCWSQYKKLTIKELQRLFKYNQ